MAVSDRDKKIIYFLLIVMVIALPYMFFIKNKRDETTTLRLENEAKAKRLEELQIMDRDRQRYKDETADMQDELNAIVATFPSGVKQANYLMFLLQTQYSGEHEINEEGLSINTMPIWFNQVEFGEDIDTAISSEDADTGLTGITNSSVVGYSTNYRGLKHLLAYVMEYQDPMSYNKFTMSFDEESGTISGEFLLNQYAIIGDDRPAVPSTNYYVDINGTTVDSSIDTLGIRGNQDEEQNGIFGPTEDYVADEDADANNDAFDEDDDEGLPMENSDED